MTRRFAAWGFLVFAVAIVAGAVLFAARAQQATADKNFAEARIASDMQVAVLQQERGLDGYVVSRQPSELRVYFSGERQLTRKLEPAKPAEMSQVLGGQVDFFDEVGDRLFESVEVAAYRGVGWYRVADL